MYIYIYRVNPIYIHIYIRLTLNPQRPLFRSGLVVLEALCTVRSLFTTSDDWRLTACQPLNLLMGFQRFGFVNDLRAVGFLRCRVEGRFA